MIDYSVSWDLEQQLAPSRALIVVCRLNKRQVWLCLEAYGRDNRSIFLRGGEAVDYVQRHGVVLFALVFCRGSSRRPLARSSRDRVERRDTFFFFFARLGYLFAVAILTLVGGALRSRLETKQKRTRGFVSSACPFA